MSSVDLFLSLFLQSSLNKCNNSQIRFDGIYLLLVADSMGLHQHRDCCCEAHRYALQKVQQEEYSNVATVPMKIWEFRLPCACGHIAVLFLYISIRRWVRSWRIWPSSCRTVHSLKHKRWSTVKLDWQLTDAHRFPTMGFTECDSLRWEWNAYASYFRRKKEGTLSTWS